MLREVKIRSLSYDASADTLTVSLEASVSVNGKALALVDAKKQLVGLDLRDDDGAGFVAMAGPHEAVHSTHPVEVKPGASSGPTILRASRVVEVAGKNPYV